VKPADLLAGLPDSRRTLWIFAALMAGLCAFGNLPWHLDNYDQAKQAFVSYEIAAGGNPFFQHTPRGQIATKPPLAGWISLPVYWLTGWWQLAWRLPGYVATVILAVWMFREGERLWPRAGALLALCAFGLNMLTPRLATLVRTDMLLTLWITACGLLILHKVQTGAAWKTHERWAFLGAMLAALLTKGPVIYAFLLPGMAAFAWLAPRGRKALVWSGWWTWLLPLLVFLGWGIAGLATNPEFYQQIVVEEFFSRFDQDLKSHERRQPFWFYFPHLLHKFLPWSILLLGIPALSKNVRRAVRVRPELLWLACWAIGGLIAMTLVPSKRVDRIYPVIPPFCLLLVGMAGACQCGARIRAWCGAAIVAAAAVWTAYFVVVVSIGFADGYHHLARFGREADRTAQAAGISTIDVISGNDEALALYAGETETLHHDRAVRRWNNGESRALLLPARRLVEDQISTRAELPPPALDSGEVLGGERYLLYLRK
jgi:4-amino-4-deoxy-L-arabinose transferase-like glycosyltransferase